MADRQERADQAAGDRQYHSDGEKAGLAAGEQFEDARRSATFLATTPGQQVGNENCNETWRRVRLEKVQVHETSSIQSLQESVQKLQEQLSVLTAQQSRTREGHMLLESSLVKQARKRLRFDSKDVRGSIDSWNHYFRLYHITSDTEKFYAVEQLLPVHVQRALSTNAELETSYFWLVAYLENKFEPRFMCHEMRSKSLTKNTHMNELEDLAVEAASCPKEHLIKHFMLEACSQGQRQQMKPYILLPMKEFKFKMKMIAQEERSSGGNSFYSNRRFPQHAPALEQRENSGRNMPNSNFPRVNAVREATSTTSQEYGRNFAPQEVQDARFQGNDHA